jgi:hypothetical protein
MPPSGEVAGHDGAATIRRTGRRPDCVFTDVKETPEVENEMAPASGLSDLAFVWQPVLIPTLRRRFWREAPGPCPKAEMQLRVMWISKIFSSPRVNGSLIGAHPFA